LGTQHDKKPLSKLVKSKVLMMTLVKGFHQPMKPVWGDRYMFFSPVIVEELRIGTNVPNWKYFLGFGHQFLMNASETNDGLLYFCIGFSISTTCQRDRHAIVYLDLAPDAAESLEWIHHSEEKVKKIIADVKAYPIRRFNLGTIVPGVIVPRVVGTIGEAGISIQEGFYAAVNTLFYKNGTLPTEYTLHSKLQVEGIKQAAIDFRRKQTFEAGSKLPTPRPVPAVLSKKISTRSSTAARHKVVNESDDHSWEGGGGFSHDDDDGLALGMNVFDAPTQASQPPVWGVQGQGSSMQSFSPSPQVLNRGTPIQDVPHSAQPSGYELTRKQIREIADEALTELHNKEDSVVQRLEVRNLRLQDLTNLKASSADLQQARADIENLQRTLEEVRTSKSDAVERVLALAQQRLEDALQGQERHHITTLRESNAASSASLTGLAAGFAQEVAGIIKAFMTVFAETNKETVQALREVGAGVQASIVSVNNLAVSNQQQYTAMSSVMEQGFLALFDCEKKRAEREEARMLRDEEREARAEARLQRIEDAEEERLKREERRDRLLENTTNAFSRSVTEVSLS
jgi:hypothetical protein